MKQKIQNHTQSLPVIETHYSVKPIIYLHADLNATLIMYSVFEHKHLPLQLATVSGVLVNVEFYLISYLFTLKR
jgi:hypothetical protein